MTEVHTRAHEVTAIVAATLRITAEQEISRDELYDLAQRIRTHWEIGEQWTPREHRHSFVSIMSDSGVSIETIADLCGHAGTAVTEIENGVPEKLRNPI